MGVEDHILKRLKEVDIPQRVQARDRDRDRDQATEESETVSLDSEPAFSAASPEESESLQPASGIAGRRASRASSASHSAQSPQHRSSSPSSGRAEYSSSAPASLSGLHELRSDLRVLTSSINELLQVFSKASEDMRAEPAAIATAPLSQKLDKLIEQNEEIGRGILLLLELHREHLPQIAKHTRLSSEMKLRKPSHLFFSQRSSGTGSGSGSGTGVAAAQAQPRR